MKSRTFLLNYSKQFWQVWKTEKGTSHLEIFHLQSKCVQGNLWNVKALPLLSWRLSFFSHSFWMFLSLYVCPSQPKAFKLDFAFLKQCANVNFYFSLLKSKKTKNFLCRFQFWSNKNGKFSFLKQVTLRNISTLLVILEFNNQKLWICRKEYSVACSLWPI